MDLISKLTNQTYNMQRFNEPLKQIKWEVLNTI